MCGTIFMTQPGFIDYCKTLLPDMVIEAYHILPGSDQFRVVDGR